jgi:hypothetical protein
LRFQFSLRALLIAFLILAVALGALTAHYRKKERAIARLLNLGASVSFDHEWSATPPLVFDDAELPGNSFLRLLLGEHYAANPVEVQLFAGNREMRPDLFTDDDAALLASIPSIKWLVLYDTRLTDVGLAQLARITSLERLDIEGTLVSAEGVEAFRIARSDVKVFSDSDYDTD